MEISHFLYCHFTLLCGLNWAKEATEKLEPEIENIEEVLLDAYYVHLDESQIKVGGTASNEVCA